MGRVSLSVIRRAEPRFSDAAARRIIGRTLTAAGWRGSASLTLLWTDDREMRTLNRRHRGRDRTTDVLSFPLRGRAFWPGEGRELGDIAVSVPEAKREARREGRRYRDEIALLLAHGTLHLLGHDHVQRRDRRRMFSLQNRVLRSLGALDAAILPLA